jgi:hypothetical protein
METRGRGKVSEAKNFIGLLFIVCIVGATALGQRGPNGNFPDLGSYTAYHEGTQGLLNGVNPYPPRSWIQDKDRPDEARFVYSPTFALFFYPFSVFYNPIGMLAWVALGAAVFWYGVRYALIIMERDVSLVQGKWLFWGTVMMFNETLKCMLSTQVNALIAGIVMLSVGLYFSGRFRMAAIMLAFVTNFKIFPIVMALLLCLEFNRSFIIYFFGALATSFAIPFLVASPKFNLELLQNWWFFIAHDTIKIGFLGLEPSLRFFGFAPSADAFMIFTLLNAAAIAALTWKIFALNRGAFIRISVPLALSFMLLFNKRTESPTLVVGLPVLVLMLQAYLEERKNLRFTAARTHLFFMVAAWWLLDICFSDLTPKPLRQIAHEYRFMFFGMIVLYLWAWVRGLTFLVQYARVNSNHLKENKG